MRVLRFGANGKWMFGVCALVLIGAVWISFFRTPPESWQLLAQGKLVKIEAEQAIYEKPDSPDYFVRVRITNLSSQVVVFDRYENLIVSKGRIEPVEATCELSVTNRPNPINRLRPIILGNDAGIVKQSARAKFQANKLPRIPAGASREFFLKMPKSKIRITRLWNSCPLWMKAKIFLPQSFVNSLSLVVLFDGHLTVTNSKNSQTFEFIKNYFTLKFPVKTKILP